MHIDKYEREGLFKNGDSHCCSVTLLYAQLNDFNRARFIRWNAVKREVCPFYIEMSPSKVSSTSIIFHDGVIFVSNNLKFLTMVTLAHFQTLVYYFRTFSESLTRGIS